MLQVPDALFMIYDTVVVFDHFRSILTIVTHVELPRSPSEDIEPAYQQACALLQSILATIQRNDTRFLFKRLLIQQALPQNLSILQMSDKVDMRLLSPSSNDTSLQETLFKLFLHIAFLGLLLFILSISIGLSAH